MSGTVYAMALVIFYLLLGREARQPELRTV